MNDVYLIGIGQTKISKNAGIRGRYLSAEAVSKALEHAGIEKELITMFITGNMMSGILTQQQQSVYQFVALTNVEGNLHV